MPKGIKTIIDERPSAERITSDLACGRAGCKCMDSAQQGYGYTHCPHPDHDDNDPSLDVTERGGIVLLVCRAGCDNNDVIDALRGLNLWTGRSNGNGSKKQYTGPVAEDGDLWWYEHGHDVPVQEFDYTNEQGGVVIKTYKQSADGHKRFWREPKSYKGKVPLYNLRLLKQHPDANVYVVEGEKDADRLSALGLLATTCIGGAGKWKPEHTETLRGRKVAVLADNDAPGLKHAKVVANALSGVAVVVKLVELPDLPDKGDVSDWLDAGHTVDELKALVKAAPELSEGAAPQPSVVDKPPADGAALLNEVVTLIRRYIVLDTEQADAIALWTAHTYAIDAVDVTPYLAIMSALERCGKSRLLEVLKNVVRRPWKTSKVSTAVLVRKIDTMKPTLLLDEVDAMLKSGSEFAEALRGVLNSGYESDGVSSLCVKQGSNVVFVDLVTFCPKALAGIGDLPTTVTDRSIRIQMKRKRPGDEVERLRRRRARDETEQLRTGLEQWATVHEAELRDAEPQLLDELDDRATDAWEPLFAIADLAGGDWSQRARTAALRLSTGDVRENDSLGVRLLSDVRDVFTSKDVDKLLSADLVRALLDIEEAPWSDIRGKPLVPNKLAWRLKPFAVRSRLIRVRDRVGHGYRREDLEDAWTRYLPPLSGVTSVTNVTPNECDVTPVTAVTPGEGGESPVFGEDDF